MNGALKLTRTANTEKASQVITRSYKLNYACLSSTCETPSKEIQTKKLYRTLGVKNTLVT